MKELLSSYSIEEIILFIVLIALAIKGLVSSYDWVMERLRDYVDESHSERKKEEELIGRVSHNSEVLTQLEKNQVELTKSLSSLEGKIDLLMDSDKDSIKSYLVDKYNQFNREQYIDSYEYDCFLKRYSHYKKEGGNSYIENLVEKTKELKDKV